MPVKTERASYLLTELARARQRGGMSQDDKKAGKDLLHQVIRDIYGREGKDEWAQWEEIE